MREQYDHAPTREYMEVIFKYAKRSGYKMALEVGTGWGISAIVILEAGKGTLVSIDKLECVTAKKEIERYGLRDRIVYIQGDSRIVLPMMGGQFGFIAVDGSHRYEDVRSDLENCWPLLRKGGFLFVDDYSHPKNETGEYGVRMAVDGFISSRHPAATFEKGKAILRK